MQGQRFKLSGARVIVTGGTKGIGAGVVEELAVHPPPALRAVLPLRSAPVLQIVHVGAQPHWTRSSLALLLSLRRPGLKVTRSVRRGWARGCSLVRATRTTSRSALTPKPLPLNRKTSNLNPKPQPQTLHSKSQTLIPTP